MQKLIQTMIDRSLLRMERLDKINAPELLIQREQWHLSKLKELLNDNESERDTR